MGDKIIKYTQTEQNKYKSVFYLEILLQTMNSLPKSITAYYCLILNILGFMDILDYITPNIDADLLCTYSRSSRYQIYV